MLKLNSTINYFAILAATALLSSFDEGKYDYIKPAAPFDMPAIAV